ncbi:MAG: DMT family transporter [Proteobacteria bacterium]|nr:DMT family transporter [Pseudomonadota bacterium]
MTRGEVLAIFAGTTTGVTVGSAMVATRFVIVQTDPASLALLRYGIGALGLIVPLLMVRRVIFDRRDLLPIALLGIGQFGILVALLNYGLRFIGSGLGALLFATFPLMTMALAAALRLEALTIAKIAGVLLTAAGVGLAVFDHIALPDADGNNLLGVTAVLASALTGAVCSVFYRPYLEKYPPLQVSVFAMLASVLFLVLPAAGEGFFSDLPTFTPAGWLAVLFIGLASSLGYYTWLLALKHASPTRVAMFLALGPVTATALGSVLLDEPVSPLFLAGLAAVVTGLWAAHRPGPR